MIVGGIGIVLVGVVTAGAMVERDRPALTGQPSDNGWAQAVVEPSSKVLGGANALPTSGPASASATPVRPGSARYVFPVSGKVTYARTHHDYPATDIIAACGSPVVAVTDGVVLEVSRKDSYDTHADDGATRGGLFISMLGDDGVRYYGSHLRRVLPAVDAKVRVKAGQRLGEVGNTGDAGVCHLHFGISPPCARTADWWVRRGTIWPWSYLDAWQTSKPLSPAPEITAWTQKNGCPGAPAS